MTKHTHLARSALPAVFAALALGSTPLLAQDIVTPPPVSTGPSAPVPAPPAASTPSAPTVVVPAPIVQTGPNSAPGATPSAPTPRQPTNIVTNPVVQQVPPPPVIDSTATTTNTAAPVATTASTRPAARNAAPAPVSTAPQTANTTPDMPPAPIAEDAATLPVATAPLATNDAPIAAEPATAPADDAVGLPAELQLLAVLAALGLLIGGLVLLRRRRRSDAVAAPVVERPLVERSVEPVAAEPVIVDPVMAEPAVAERPPARVQPIVEPAHPGALPHAGASVALPRDVPESAEEREALIQRMVAAKPDRANPFRTPRARMKRARLILQSLGRTFDREPGIDLSQYPNNWPELARRDYSQVA